MTGFDPAEFVNDIGKQLVHTFEYAGMAGTPSLVGAAREHTARMQLAELLPGLLSVGTGLLIDSYGERSKQQDIVIYERDFCPVYSISGAPESKYFPVEGVVAAGEVKSAMGKQVLQIALDNVKSAKALRRRPEIDDHGISLFRLFGSTTTHSDSRPGGSYDQATSFRGQVYGFILCNKFKQSPETVLENLVEYQRANGSQYMPDLIVSLNDGFIQGMRSSDQTWQPTIITADSYSFIPAPDRAFTYLVHELEQHVREGRTVPLRALRHYMTSLARAMPGFTTRRFE